MSASVCLLSFDIEDWFQTENLRPAFPVETWEDLEPRVEANTRRILDILARRGVPATFFVLGWVAERSPALVREIAAAGHEVASHGYGHVMPTRLGLDEFRADLRRARGVLEEFGGPVRGYRAPNYAIDDERLGVVFEEGHVYDSSHHPVDHHDRYGRLTRFAGEVKPGVLRVEGGGYEFVLPVARLGPVRLPASGGGWFRLYPGSMSRVLARRIVAEWGHTVLYLHPWEFDPGQPRAGAAVSRVNRWRHYNNLGRTAARLDGLIGAFRADGVRFARMGEYLVEVTGETRCP